MAIEDRDEPGEPTEALAEQASADPQSSLKVASPRRRSRLTWIVVGVVVAVGVGGLLVDGNGRSLDDETAAPARARPMQPGSDAVRPAVSASTTAPLISAPPATLAGGDLNRSAFIVPEGSIPPSSADEPTGNFRAECMFSHLSYDDPIMYPGEPGASHLHMFFGNTLADATSTYESLLSTGDSTCSGGPLNRSGYWAPAVIDGDGKVVVPEYLVVYYKGNIGSGPEYREQIRSIVGMPPGLRMIAGFDKEAPDAEPQFDWYCSETSHKAQTIPTCPPDELIGVALLFPTCWDGVNLDSPNHRSHMAYRVSADDGSRHCPDSHPVALPEFTLGVWYANSGDSQEWSLSSDSMPGMVHASGSTFHSDWFGAWDPETQETWVAECIRAMRDCVFGELGDGTRLVEPAPYTGPKRLDPPPAP